MLAQPKWQSRSNSRSVLGLVDQGELLTCFEIRLHGVEELNWERVSLVNIWNVAIKTSFGVVIGKKANVLEFPPEN